MAELRERENAILQRQIWAPNAPNLGGVGVGSLGPMLLDYKGTEERHSRFGMKQEECKVRGLFSKGTERLEGSLTEGS